MSILLDNVSVTVNSRTLVNRLNCQFDAGQFWGIIGPNGVGKTTLLHSICSLHPVSNGTIYLNKKKLSSYGSIERAKTIALMQQDYENHFPSTVHDAIKLARLPYQLDKEHGSTYENMLLAEVIEKTQLDNFLKREINTLSGGEKRLVHLAMLLAQNTTNQLLDEPTNHLDIAHLGLLMKVITKEHQQQQKTNLIVTHDINLVSQFCTHALLLFPNNHWIAGEVSQVMTSENISNLFQVQVQYSQNKGKKYFYPDWNNS